MHSRARSSTSLGVKPQDMTALSIDYVITLTGGALVVAGVILM